MRGARAIGVIAVESRSTVHVATIVYAALRLKVRCEQERRSRCAVIEETTRCAR